MLIAECASASENIATAIVALGGFAFLGFIFWVATGGNRRR
jgi:hypothetical protein